MEAWNKYTLYYTLGQAASHLSGLMESLEGIALASKELRQARAMELLASANRVKLNSIDDALRVGDNAVAIVGGGLEKAAEFIRNTARREGMVDVLIHGAGNDFKILVRTDEGIVETIIDHRGLAKWLYKKGLHKHKIRLLSCSNAESAQDLARKLGQEVLYTPDVVRLHSDGGISTVNNSDWYTYSGSSRTQTIAERPRPPSQKSADDFVQMGGGEHVPPGGSVANAGAEKFIRDWDVLEKGILEKLNVPDKMDVRKLSTLVKQLKNRGEMGVKSANVICSGIFDGVDGYYDLASKLASTDVNYIHSVDQAMDRGTQLLKEGLDKNLLCFEKSNPAVKGDWLAGNYDVDLAIKVAPGSSEYAVVYQFKTLQGKLDGSKITDASKQLMHAPARNKIVEIRCVAGTSPDAITSESAMASMKRQILPPSKDLIQSGINEFHFYIPGNNPVIMKAAEVEAFKLPVWEK
jgi:hypothetical protein